MKLKDTGLLPEEKLVENDPQDHSDWKKQRRYGYNIARREIGEIDVYLGEMLDRERLRIEVLTVLVGSVHNQNLTAEQEDGLASQIANAIIAEIDVCLKE